jgi:predicted transcriptional regulator
MVDARIVRELLREREMQPQEIGGRVGATYQEVTVALGELMRDELARPTQSGKFGLTDAGRRLS